jgi:glycosyltransferase involved in cell wall biosynthesis
MKPIRVLHVLGAMNRGGVETWLMHVLRRIDRERFAMDFLVHTAEPAAYDAEVLALGSRILRCSHPHDPVRYRKRFLEIAERCGPFAVVHSHVHHYSGYVLWLARAAKVPVRISHSHNDTESLNREATLLRKAYLMASRKLISANCTHALAASGPAALALFGPRWQTDPRVRVLYYGVDLDAFRLPADRSAVRAEFGFRADDIVFGHVGRFDPQKNHTFLAEIAIEILKREANARFLLVGDGPLRSSIEQQFQRAGILGSAVFTGSRSDVPRLMLGAMDEFLFPSLYEGLGLVLIEAQAANLPAIVSDRVPSEAIVVPGLVRCVSLNQPAATWAEAALHHRECRASNALATVERSPFNITASVEALTRVYSAHEPF